MTAHHRANGRTSADVRRAIRGSTESLAVLAKRYAINPKTVAKWKKRDSPDDLPSGPQARNGKLTAEEEDIIVQFREHTLLPLDDCLYALQAQIPQLSRSSLHRCLQRHGISRLVATGGRTAALPDTREAVPLGWLHIDTNEVQTAEGAHYLFNAIDQASKFVFVRMGGPGGAADAAAFLATLVRRVPFRISRVFTADAEPFVATDGESLFARACRAQGIEHRLTSGPHPWTGRRGSRMGRIIKNNVTFASAAYLASLLQQFVEAYNFRRRLKTLGGRTPYDYICQKAEEQPRLFLRDPHHEMVGLEIMFS
jgi:transposase InsO family protein